MPQIYPSLIASNLLTLKSTIDDLEAVVAGWHIDIMDNHFVPNLTWGASFANAIDAYSKKQSWVHLMIDEPMKFMSQLILKPNSIVTFHIETNDDKTELIHAIRAKKWLAGIAISPKTDVVELLPFLGLVDQALIMSVNPGHSGQPFIPTMTERVALVAQEITSKGYTTTLACDGGINRTTIKPMAQAGATQFAIATGIFGAQDPVAQTVYLAQ